MVYYPGRYLQQCDICGFEGYNTEMVKTWDNLIVHRATSYDGPRSVLDKPPPRRPERQNVRDPRPDSNVEPTILETVAVNTIADTTAASGGNITDIEIDGDLDMFGYSITNTTEINATSFFGSLAWSYITNPFINSTGDLYQTVSNGNLTLNESPNL